MKKEDWWILGFVCFLFIDFFMIIGHFVFSTESGEISMSNALVVDQAHVLKRKDLKMVGKINQTMMRQNYPAQLWVRILKNKPRGLSSSSSNFYVEDEVKRTYHMMKRENKPLKHTISWYDDHTSILVIVIDKNDTLVELASNSIYVSNMQRQYLHWILPKPPCTRLGWVTDILGYAWFVAGHAGLDGGTPNIEFFSSAVFLGYLSIIFIIALARFARNDGGNHGGPEIDKDDDYWIEDEELTYGDDDDDVANGHY